VKNEILTMKRFCIDEQYEICNPVWNHYYDREEKAYNFWLRIESDKAITQSEDTAYIFQALNWEINVVEKSLREEDIRTGFKYFIPDGYDETRGGWITNFYFCEHMGTDKNHIEIIDTDGDSLLVRLSGEIPDVNFYDDSKANTKLLLEAWFRRDGDSYRSMC